MKKLLISTAAIALLFGAASAAPGDDNNNDNDKHKTHATQGNGPDRGMQGPTQGANTMQGPAPASNNTMQGPGGANAMTGNATSNESASDRRRELNQNAAEERRQRNQNAADERRQRNQNAAEERRDRNQNAADTRQQMNQNADRNRTRIDVTKYHRNFTAPHRFHAQAYRGPSGYHYRRWTYGERLPSIYWAHNYWLTDFLMFGLMAPPDGYVWVRYGDDALLIDEYTGEIIQVEYDVFY